MSYRFIGNAQGLLRKQISYKTLDRMLESRLLSTRCDNLHNLRPETTRLVNNCQHLNTIRRRQLHTNNNLRHADHLLNSQTLNIQQSSSAATAVSDIDIGSSNSTNSSNILLNDGGDGTVPDPNTVTDFASTIGENVVSNLSEQPFSEIGLGLSNSWWPPGMAQSLMEMLHIDVGLPWWQVICATTLFIRICVFPVIIISRKNMVVINKHQPQIQRLQVELERARMRGEQEKTRFAQRALMNYFQTHGCHPIKALWPILIQGSFFTTMFFALRGMTNSSVQSLSTGGLYWFQDLSVVDPFYLLPVITATSIYIQLYLGADGMDTTMAPPLMIKIMYVLPLVSLPFMAQFPAALSVYWLTNNLISIVQASLIRRRDIQQRLGIGEMIKWSPDDLPMTKFWDEAKREMELQRRQTEREQLRIKNERKARQDKEQQTRDQLVSQFEEEQEKTKRKT